MRRPLSVLFVTAFATVAAGCAAPTEDPTEEAADENVGTAQQEQRKAGPLFGSICRACGCSMVSRIIDNCTVLRCECPSTHDAECVVNAPGGARATVVPPRWTPPIYTGPIDALSP